MAGEDRPDVWWAALRVAGTTRRRHRAVRRWAGASGYADAIVFDIDDGGAR